MGPSCRMLALSALLLLQAACGSGGGEAPAAPVHALAILSAQPQDATVTVGAAATFAVTAQCADPITIQWFKGTAPIPGATAAACTTPATVKADSGTAFHATVTTVAGTVTSASATLTVSDPPGHPPVFTLHPQSQTASAGNWVLLSVAATSETPVTYSWYQGTALQQKAFCPFVFPIHKPLPTDTTPGSGGTCLSRRPFGRRIHQTTRANHFRQDGRPSRRRGSSRSRRWR